MAKNGPEFADVPALQDNYNAKHYDQALSELKGLSFKSRFSNVQSAVREFQHVSSQTLKSEPRTIDLGKMKVTTKRVAPATWILSTSAGILVPINSEFQDYDLKRKADRLWEIGNYKRAKELYELSKIKKRTHYWEYTSQSGTDSFKAVVFNDQHSYIQLNVGNEGFVINFRFTDDPQNWIEVDAATLGENGITFNPLSYPELVFQLLCLAAKYAVEDAPKPETSRFSF